MAENNEELLREGECIVSYCVEPAVRGKFCASHGCGHGWDSQELCTCYKSGLRAENARLQERVKAAKRDKAHLFESIDKTLDALAEALGAAAFSPEHTDSPAKYVRILTEERDGYKAEAERRKKALVRFGEHDDTCPDYLEMASPATRACDCGLGAAIAAEALEKED